MKGGYPEGPRPGGTIVTGGYPYGITCLGTGKEPAIPNPPGICGKCPRLDGLTGELGRSSYLNPCPVGSLLIAEGVVGVKALAAKE